MTGWTGSNAFRMMPTDEFAHAPATAVLSTGAGGHLTSLAYTWVHPTDGPQEGLLVYGDGVTALWGDSWHQQPEPRVLEGSRADDGSVELSYEYGGGWRWEIAVRTSDEAVLLEMRNVIPADQATDDIAAGPYPVMVMELRPA